MRNYEFNVSNSNPKDQKILYEFGEEMNFNIRQQGLKSDREKSMIKLLKSPANMASGVTTIVLPKNRDDLCNRLKLLLQERQAGKNSNIF